MQLACQLMYYIFIHAIGMFTHEYEYMQVLFQLIH
jgi:hypothetical protein